MTETQGIISADLHWIQDQARYFRAQLGVKNPSAKKSGVWEIWTEQAERYERIAASLRTSTVPKGCGCVGCENDHARRSDPSPREDVPEREAVSAIRNRIERLAAFDVNDSQAGFVRPERAVLFREEVLRVFDQWATRSEEPKR